MDCWIKGWIDGHIAINIILGPANFNGQQLFTCIPNTGKISPGNCFNKGSGKDMIHLI